MGCCRHASIPANMTAQLCRQRQVAARTARRAPRNVCISRRPYTLHIQAPCQQAWPARRCQPRRLSIAQASLAAPFSQAPSEPVPGRLLQLWRRAVRFLANALALCCLAAATIAMAAWSRCGATTLAPAACTASCRLAVIAVLTCAMRDCQQAHTIARVTGRFDYTAQLVVTLLTCGSACRQSRAQGGQPVPPAPAADAAHAADHGAGVQSAPFAAITKSSAHCCGTSCAHTCTPLCSLY